jgi:hypothetical protein
VYCGLIGPLFILSNMPDEAIRLDVHPKFLEFAQACAFVFLQRYWIAVAGVTAIVLLETAGTWLLIAQGKLPIVNPYASFWLMQIGYVVLLTSPFRAAWRSQKDDLKQISPVYTLDGEGVSVPSDGADLRTPWSSIRFVQETRRQVLVHTTPSRFWVLPKRSFSKSDVQRLRETTSGVCIWKSNSLLGRWF